MSTSSGGVGEAPGLEVEIAGVFSRLAEAEDKLGGKAQSSLEKLPVGHAAELMEAVVTKGEAIKNADKYVTAAANRWEKAAADEKAAAEEKATAEEEAQANIPVENRYQDYDDRDDEDEEDEVVRGPEVEGVEVPESSPESEVVEVPDPNPEGEEVEGWGWQHDAGEEDGRGWQDETVWEEEAAGWGDDYWWEG